MTEETFMIIEQNYFPVSSLSQNVSERKEMKLKIVGEKLIYRPAPSSVGYLPKHGSFK
jgi:hypothetical protein